MAQHIATIVVDATGISVSGEAALMVGHTILWPRKRGASDDRRAIGVLRQPNGGLRLVASPIRDSILYPRAAADGHGAWHVIFFTGSERQNPGSVDSAEVWYGRYDGSGWHDVRRVGALRMAQLHHQRASALVAPGNDLVFAMPFDAHRALPLNAPNAYGVVMLSRRSGKWRQDSLFTHDAPAAVSIGARRGQPAIDVGIAQEYFENHRFFPQSMFVARFDTGWHAPVRVSEGSTGPSAARCSSNSPQARSRRGSNRRSAHRVRIFAYGPLRPRGPAGARPRRSGTRGRARTCGPTAARPRRRG